MTTDAVRAPGVAFKNLGCRVNRVELDTMAAAVAGAGVALVAEEAADVIVVNTCAVTGEAQAKTRKAVHHAAMLPRRPTVVATGCVAMLFADELAGVAPNVVVEPNKAAVPELVLELLGMDVAGGTDAEKDGPRMAALTPTGRTRPGIKVQDGCDNRCTYCIVWKARGTARSMPLEEAVAQVAEQVARGAREVVLTGINLGRYDGADANGAPTSLPVLLDALLSRTDVGRVRLSSVEPQDVGEDLLRLIAGSDGRVAPFLHVPLQSGSDAVLVRMGRRYTVAEFLAMCDRARELVPGVSLGTDLIVGFPGETDDEFAESLATSESAGFSRMHVFRYSKRPGTPAAAALDQVAPATSAERSARMRELADAMRRTYVAGRVGHEELVCVESPGRGTTGGLVGALVDEAIPTGSLVRVVPHALATPSTLDAR